MRIVVAICGTLLSAGVANAHEAWLLTPTELEELSRLPIPPVFTNLPLLMTVSLCASVVLYGAVLVEERYRIFDSVFLWFLNKEMKDVVPLAIRLGMAATIGLSALGALPRHGTKLWSEPTLFVPDMMLSTLNIWLWQWLLGSASLTVCMLLLIGLATRFAAIVIIVLSFAGCILFGKAFTLHYAGHFIAPAILLFCCGAGKYSADSAFQIEYLNVGGLVDPRLFLGITQLLTGLTFVSLAVSVKFMQPTLLIAVLDHADFDFFKIPLPIAALIIMYVELLAGVLLIFGRMVRPIAFFLLCAFTFFAVILGESPAMHANLYGLMFAFLLYGGSPLSVSLSWQRPALAPYAGRA